MSELTLQEQIQAAAEEVTRVESITSRFEALDAYAAIAEAGFTISNPQLELKRIILQNDIARLEQYEEANHLAVGKSNQQKINAEAKAYLASTDWYVIREFESGVACPPEIKEARESARAAVLENE